MNDYNVIKEKFKSLPKDLQAALSSTEVSKTIESISNRHELMLDQASELFDLTSDVMLGLSPSKDFVGNLAKRAGIGEEKANAIATDINNEVFGSIRASLRKMQEESENQPLSASITAPPATSSTISPIEKAGGFTIEMQKPSSSPIYNDSNLKRDEVLNDLENIEKLKPSNAIAFVDHLLANPVSHEQKIEIKKPAAPSTPTKPSVDPYREQI